MYILIFIDLYTYISGTYSVTISEYAETFSWKPEQVHLVNKVSRLLQPSVIYIDGAEKPFVKKVPKTDKTDPKRLKKDLPKIIKGISQDDQVGMVHPTTRDSHASQSTARLHLMDIKQICIVLYCIVFIHIPQIQIQATPQDMEQVKQSI
jgi:hypothetical protein